MIRFFLTILCAIGMTSVASASLVGECDLANFKCFDGEPIVVQEKLNALKNFVGLEKVSVMGSSLTEFYPQSHEIQLRRLSVYQNISGRHLRVELSNGEECDVKRGGKSKHVRPYERGHTIIYRFDYESVGSYLGLNPEVRLVCPSGEFAFGNYFIEPNPYIHTHLIGVWDLNPDDDKDRYPGEVFSPSESFLESLKTDYAEENSGQ